MRPSIQLRKWAGPIGAKWCQMVPNGATLVLLPPVTTGSEEDPGTPAGRLDPGFSPASRGDPGVSVVCAVAVVTPFFRMSRKVQGGMFWFEYCPSVSS